SHLQLPTTSTYVHASVTSSLLHYPAPPHLHTLSLHNALPISEARLRTGSALARWRRVGHSSLLDTRRCHPPGRWKVVPPRRHLRSEEHTSELQSRENLVCRLLLEKKK